MTTRTHSGWFTQLQQIPHQYVAIDGGTGAHLLAALAERHPYLNEVASPRHANLLLIVEPVCQKLAPALAEIAKALAHPAHVLLIGEIGSELAHFSTTAFARVEEILPGSRRIPQASVEAILDAILGSEPSSELALNSISEPEATTISLPPKQDQEMATELAVLSLGPVQPLTAGPVRLFLVCDGEQVLSVQVEAGYAYRGIAEAMVQADWQQALQLARCLDPLAPIASQLAYVSAVEQLQGWQPPMPVTTLREAALALERAQNALWWLVRFASILADVQLTDRASLLATELAEVTSQLWQQPPLTWIGPQGSIPTSTVVRNTSAIANLRQITDSVEALRTSVERNRLLGIRTRGIGRLAAERLATAHVSGPVLEASEHGDGDVQSRLVVRLQHAARDLREVAKTLPPVESVPTQEASWSVPAGEAKVTVKGPRGAIGLHLESSGGEKPAHVEWQSPSAALLPLLEELLVGQKLADAEVIVASLDLAMAEADG